MHDEILDFWFGAADENGLCAPDYTKRWWTKDPAFDAEVTERFLDAHEAVAAERDGWGEGPSVSLGRIIALDQFSRNMFRDSPRMYATDDAALAHARALLPKLSALPAHRASMALMPFMHSERRDAQDESLANFTALANDPARSAAAREALRGLIGYAESHRDVVVRFGRFPHRNAILGRASTEEEKKYLEDPKAGW